MKLTIDNFVNDTYQPPRINTTWLYRFNNEIDDPLYIGFSTDVYARVLQHLGLADQYGNRRKPVGTLPNRNTSVGSYVYDHLPNSLSWSVGLLTPNECIPIINSVDQWFAQQYSLLVVNDPVSASKLAEPFLIKHYKPRLNVLHNA